MTWLRTRNGRVVGAVLGVALAGASLAADTKAKKPPASTEVRTGSLPEPGWLPALARDLLHRRMQSHGKDVVRLVLASTLLEHGAAKEIAHRIATEPRISRPVAGSEDALNSSLPPRFFELQDALRTQAKAVEQAAAKKDDAALGAAVGQLTQTCVACHSVYLNPPAPAQDTQQP